MGDRHSLEGRSLRRLHAGFRAVATLGAANRASIVAVAIAYKSWDGVEGQVPGLGDARRIGPDLFRAACQMLFSFETVRLLPAGSLSCYRRTEQYGVVEDDA